MAGSLKDCPGTAGNHSTANFEYDDNEWDIGIGDLIIDLDADIEKTGVGEGMAAPKPGKMHSPVEHQATVDKGLKMKIKRTKPGTKHEIVKSENVEKKRGSGHKKDKKHEKGAAKDMNGVRLVAVEGGSGAVQPQAAVPPAASSPEKQADDSPPALKKLKPLTNTASNNTNGNGSGNSLPSTSSGISSAGSSCSSNGPALVSSPAPPPLTPQVPQSPNLLSLPHYISPSNSPPPALPVPLPREVADAATGTSVGTITEPDCLGHCEPGTSVTLEGIVWHETEGVLVVNVTWRGKTYVGTLIDCTKHAWAPPRFCDSPTNELDLRAPKGRGKRGRAAAAAAAANNLDFAETRSTLKLRSNNAPSTSKGRRGPGASSPTQFATPKSDSTLGKRKSKVPDDEQPSTSGTASTSKRRAVSSRSTSPLQPVLLECPEPNCSKKYKHINGLKYHQSHAHGTNVEEEEVKETVTSEEEDHSAAVAIEIKKEETEEPPPPVIDENPEPLEKPLPAPPFNNDDLNDEPPAPLTRACTPTSPSPPLIEPAISDEPPSQPPTLTKVPPLPIKTPPLEDPISPVPSPSSDLNMPQPVMPQIQQPQHDPPMQQSLTEREKQHDVQEFQSQQLPQPQLPQSQTPPLLHTQSQTPPQLHTQAQTPPQLHTQSQTPPQLHTQSQTPPQLHTQSQTPPQLHTQPQTPPQLHTQSQTPPQLHTQSQTPPQLHTQSQTPPQLHTQSQTPPQLHTQSQTPPQLHTQSQTPPQLHTQSQSQIQSRPVTPLQPQLQLHHHQQLQQQPQPQSQQQLQPHLPQSQQPSHSQLLSSPSQQHHISQIQIQPHLQQQQPLQLSQQHSQQTHSQVTMHQQQQHVLIQQQQHQQIQMQIQHLQQQQQIVQQHQIVQQFHQQSQKKKTKKSPPNSPILSPLEQPPSLGIETTGREGVTSPAYSDISDDAAPLLESEVEGKPKLDDKKDGQSAPMQLCGMYNPYYSQPPYLVPSVPEKAKELLAEKAERESKVLEKEKKEGDYHQQKALAQSYYQYGFHVAGYPYNIEGGYSLVVDDKKEEKAGQISELKQATSTLHIPNPAKLKATELTVPKEKYQNENHQIIKESIEIKNQLNNSFMYQRTQQGQEEVRRYYVYPERKDGSSTKATPPPLSSQRTHPVPSPKQKDKLEDKKERSDEKKQEGVKPTMETQGPPPPPTSQYAYIHPGYMQSPHYGTLPFDPGHPMYRGVNPVIVSSFYPQLPQIHTVGRYAPEDLSRSSTNKTLDLLQNQYYSHSSHKIHELQERAIKSPVPKVTTTISSPSSSSSTPMAITSTPTTMGQGKVTPVDSKDARSPPPQRHVHTHHHTHVGLGYPILASQYPSPYGAAVLASEHAAAVTSVPYQSK